MIYFSLFHKWNEEQSEQTWNGIRQTFFLKVCRFVVDSTDVYYAFLNDQQFWSLWINVVAF
jgi:hypothetical protein